jgi:hypothetical protein
MELSLIEHFCELNFQKIIHKHSVHICLQFLPHNNEMLKGEVCMIIAKTKPKDQINNLINVSFLVELIPRNGVF